MKLVYKLLFIFIILVVDLKYQTIANASGEKKIITTQSSPIFFYGNQELQIPIFKLQDGATFEVDWPLNEASSTKNVTVVNYKGTSYFLKTEHILKAIHEEELGHYTRLNVDYKSTVPKSSLLFSYESRELLFNQKRFQGMKLGFLSEVILKESHRLYTEFFYLSYKDDPNFDFKSIGFGMGYLYSLLGGFNIAGEIFGAPYLTTLKTRPLKWESRNKTNRFAFINYQGSMYGYTIGPQYELVSIRNWDLRLLLSYVWFKTANLKSKKPKSDLEFNHSSLNFALAVGVHF